jgi:hypothetical protein
METVSSLVAERNPEAERWRNNQWWMKGDEDEQ